MKAYRAKMDDNAFEPDTCYICEVELDEFNQGMRHGLCVECELYQHYRYCGPR